MLRANILFCNPNSSQMSGGGGNWALPMSQKKNAFPYKSRSFPFDTSWMSILPQSSTDTAMTVDCDEPSYDLPLFPFFLHCNFRQYFWRLLRVCLKRFVEGVCLGSGMFFIDWLILSRRLILYSQK
jgi:hypothetical protein